MRTALLVTALLWTLALPPRASADFKCFDTPDGGWRCACVGSSDCEAMQKSGACKSDIVCDKGELGSRVCSCKAARAARAAH
ncbi:hypothetical protein [Methyloceanibacter sp.]|uniref:hypothetical protein n=1 Tax=Methyloceanibacter sp. TaxID=1965321 RepID=UPI002D4FA590|nr:hypothetical protein [Methyloceanibacter sp.]HZP08066.1 hypothetical protein [Methyloceanibacter sp.]